MVYNDTINFTFLFTKKGGGIMRKKILKYLMVFSMMLLFVVPVVPVVAVEGDLDIWGGDTVVGDASVDEDGIQSALGLGKKDPREIAASVIKVILGFLGIIAVIIILLGGFKYMVAGGSEDKTDEAKKLIYSGVVGLVIILASFAIATFVLNQLMSATGINVS